MLDRNSPTSQAQKSETEQRIGSVRNRLSEFLRCLGGDPAAAGDQLGELELLFESLPLASGEFGVAINRLRNARRYLDSDEIGAASYELRLLLGSLNR